MKFENIKVGDRIVYNTGGWYSERVVSKVVRVTPKQFVDDRDCRFDKINGCIIGDRWHRCELATEEDVKKFEEDKRRKFLANTISNFARNSSNLYSLTTEELETVYAITKKYSPAMILHRFMSDREYQALIQGKTLRNTTVHRRRGCHSTSVGFCFFAEDPEDAAHWLSGIVDFDWCVTFDVPDCRICKSKGEYGDKSNDFDGLLRLNKVVRTEYCRTAYDNCLFKIIDATDKYKGRYPCKAETDEMLKVLFGLGPIY